MAVHANSGEVGYCLTASAQQSLDAETETLIAVAHALRGEGFDASEDGTGRGVPLWPVAIQERAVSENPAAGPDGAGIRQDGAAATLRSMGHANSHQNAGGHAAVAFQDRFRGDDGRGYDRAPPVSIEVTGALETVKPWNVALPWAVRRLTPVECERLQGFPDGYTDVPQGKGRAADGPRYKQLGNSWAVNAVDWIAERITEVDQWT